MNDPSIGTVTSRFSSRLLAGCSVIALLLLPGLVHGQSVNHQKTTTAVHLFLLAVSGPRSEPVQVNVNTASAKGLESGLRGLTPELAQSIVTHRTNFGQFRSLRDLMAVDGMESDAIVFQKDQITF